MKKGWIGTLLLTCSLIFINYNTFSQLAYGQALTHTFQNKALAINAMGPEADLTNPTRSSVKIADSKAEALTARAMYMASEQYVFDNLSLLKTFYSIGDIYFDLDKSEIRPDAEVVLNNIVSLMTGQPGIKVAITSFADSRMSQYNKSLILKRAESAKAYLVSKGISADRLTIEKYGRPAVANPCDNDPSCTLAQQQLNRRTEFNVIVNGINLGQIN